MLMTIFGDGRFQNKDIAEWDESEVPTTPQCIYKSQERKRETPRYDEVAEVLKQINILELFDHLTGRKIIPALRIPEPVKFLCDYPLAQAPP